VNAKLKLTDEQRQFFREAGRRGGQIGGKVKSEAKREAGRKGGFARHARTRALRQSLDELLAVAREIGAFLDTIQVYELNEAQRRELVDRLYATVTAITAREKGSAK
jgi:hypothetical protein